MSTVVGLGKAGCSIADLFAKYPQYDILKIREGSRKDKTTNTYTMLKQKTPEDYEKKCPALKSFFKDVDGAVLFVLDGSEFISAASLKILEHLKHCQIIYCMYDRIFIFYRSLIV